MTATVVTTKAFDVVLVVHVLFAIAAVIVLVVLRTAGREVQRGGELPDAARRSFAGRPELAGRVVHLVPVSGLCLVLLSRGAYGLSSTFVLVGIALWCCAAWSLEVVGFPAQRRVAAALASGSDPVAAARSLVLAVDLAALSLVVAAIVMVTANG